MFKNIFSKDNNPDEVKLLNRYLLLGWSVIASVLFFAYGMEVIKNAFSLSYYLGFLIVTLLPLFFCIFKYKQKRDSFLLRYYIIIGYFLMYGFVMITGHTNLVFTYIFPLLCLVIFYHDSLLVALMGVVSLLLNFAFIFRDYQLGKITLENSRDYEVQIALIILCFAGCFMATVIYDRISKLNKEKEKEVMKLEEERILLAERNKYVYLDALTDLQNRRKYEEYLDKYSKSLPETLQIAILDVNDLKTVNDTLGHSAGDELIIGVAHCMKTSFHAEDNLFRIGGDEYVVFSLRSAADFEESISCFLKNVRLWKGLHIKGMSVALGTSSSEKTPHHSLKDLLLQADHRMYANKKEHYSQTNRECRNNSDKDLLFD